MHDHSMYDNNHHQSQLCAYLAYASVEYCNQSQRKHVIYFTTLTNADPFRGLQLKSMHCIVINVQSDGHLSVCTWCSRSNGDTPRIAQSLPLSNVVACLRFLEAGLQTVNMKTEKALRTVSRESMAACSYIATSSSFFKSQSDTHNLTHTRIHTQMHSHIQ